MENKSNIAQNSISTQTEETGTPILQQPPIKPKKAYKKWLLVSLVIILVLSLPLGGYFLLSKMGIKPKPSTVIIQNEHPSLTPITQLDTSNWKTYKGKGFSFEYPAGWDFNNREVYDPETISYGEYDIVSYGEKLDFILIPSLNLSIKDYITIHNKLADTNLEMTDITVNGLPGKIFDIKEKKSDNDNRGGYVAFLKNDKIFLFHSSSYNIISDPIINTIIHSLKIDSSIVPEDYIKMYAEPTFGKVGDIINIKITGIKDTNYSLEFTDSKGSFSESYRLDVKSYDKNKKEYNGVLKIPKTVLGYPEKYAQNAVDVPVALGVGKITLIHDFESENFNLSYTFTRLFSIPITVIKE